MIFITVKFTKKTQDLEIFVYIAFVSNFTTPKKRLLNGGENGLAFPSKLVHF